MCRVALEATVKQLTIETEDLTKAQDSSLQEQKVQMETRMKTTLREVEDQAASYVAKIRADADKNQNALSKLTSEHEVLVIRCDADLRTTMRLQVLAGLCSHNGCVLHGNV